VQEILAMVIAQLVVAAFKLAIDRLFARWDRPAAVAI